MRILVTGKGGMLSDYVANAAINGHEVIHLTHREFPIDMLEPAHWPVEDIDCIINCAGRVPGTGNAAEMLLANSYGPQMLALWAQHGPRVVHMSTDCVFSGREIGKPLTSKTLPDSDTAYGRSKLAGESSLPNVLNVRGSFIGSEGGFLRWILNSKGKVEAWKNSYWNGTSVAEMAEHLVDFAEGDLTGIVHVASPTLINKAAIIAHFQQELNLPFEYEYVAEPHIWRVLQPDIETTPVDEMLDDLVEELKCKTLAS